MGRVTLMRTPLPSLVAHRLTEAGVDAHACLATFGLERALNEPHVTAEVDTLAAFYDDAASRLNAPDLGLELVASIDRGAYGLAEFGIRAAPTVREAMRRLARFAVLLNEATTVTLEESDEGLHVHQAIPGHPLAGGRHSNEYFMALLVVGGRAMTQGGLEASEVWFCHPAPEHLERHRATFGTATLRFDQADNGITLSRATADRPLRSADPALMHAIDAQADTLLEQRAEGSEFVATVRASLGQALRGGSVTLADIARHLAMTPRTLQRRLADHDTSFREVVDAVRRELHARLSEQGISAQEIAFRLGYADMGSFRRAQRRWN